MTKLWYLAAVKGLNMEAEAGVKLNAYLGGQRKLN
jgi:hypothetical protein